MGLEKDNDRGRFFLHVKHGSICQESRVERPGYDRIDGVLRDGTQYTKWIKPYNAVSGYVNRIKWYDREHSGRKYRGWKIEIEDNGDIFYLDIPFESRINSRWMKVAENLDFDKTVRFSAWKDRKKDQTAFNIQQEGITVPQKYTREMPLDLPEPVQRSSGKWDYGLQEDFLVARMNKNVLPACEAAAGRRGVKTDHSDGIDNDAVMAAVAAQAFEADDNSERETLLKEIQSNLKTAAQQDKVTVPVSMEQFFGTRVWAEVERMSTMEPDVFKAAAQALLDHVVPF